MEIIILAFILLGIVAAFSPSKAWWIVGTTTNVSKKLLYVAFGVAFIVGLAFLAAWLA